MSSKKRTVKKADGFEEFVQQKGKGDEPADVEILKSEVRKLRDRLRLGTGKADLLVGAVIEHLRENPPNLAAIKAPKRDSRKDAEEVAVLHYSDSQIGKVTKSYDSSVAAARAHVLVQKTVAITEIRRSAYPVRECRLYVGGDIVEGESIFPGQSFEIDSPVIEQACGVAPAIIARMARYLLEHFDKVTVICVPGNHGRNSRFGSRFTNWDMVACRVAKVMLSDADGRLLPRLAFECTGNFFHVDRVFDWGNLIVHGDQIRGGFAGFPFYGVGKKASGWADTIKDPWDYLWFGHFHTYTSGVLNQRQYLANGTTESDNEYALEQLAAGGHPCQRLAFFTRKLGLISDNQIWLTTERRSQAARWREWSENTSKA